MKKHKLEQERLARSTDEVLGAIKTMSNYTNMFEDFEKKLKTAEQMIERSVMHVDKRVLSVGDDFNNLRREFNNQNEAFRIASRSSDTLQESYCRLVDTVSQEKKRNLLYIAKAKNDFIKELTGMEHKVEKIDNQQ